MIKTLVEDVEDLIARVGTHPVWGYRHCVRVRDLAAHVASEEEIGYDPEILTLAALLHDVGLYRAYNMREASDHAERSAVVAGRILEDSDYPPRASRAVCEAIRRHPPGTSPASSPESALLSDAVALDYLGPVGLSRVLAMVGLEEDVPDLGAAVSHAEGLRRSLPGMLAFETSRRIAEERVVEMDAFLSDLRRSTQNLELL